jgi:iron uptake system component EfeO
MRSARRLVVPGLIYVFSDPMPRRGRGASRSGHDDYGSGTTLATTGANIDGTRELLSILHPLLAPRYAGLPVVDSWLDRLQSLVGKQRRPNGTWVPVSALSTSQRQQIDAACSQALEVLAPIAAITEPRRT